MARPTNKPQRSMGKMRRKKKVHTSVKFDAEDRNTYLNSYFGAKKRRRQHYEQKKIQEDREIKHQQKLEDRSVRAAEIDRLRKLLQAEKQASKPATQKEEVHTFSDRKQRVEIRTTFT